MDETRSLGEFFRGLNKSRMLAKGGLGHSQTAARKWLLFGVAQNMG
jgi:hypothetical protein